MDESDNSGARGRAVAKGDVDISQPADDSEGRLSSFIRANLTPADDTAREATPEPQPLTRTNVTLHDTIWDPYPEARSAHVPSTAAENALSPPLKRFTERVKQTGLMRTFDFSISDEESEKSFSSQDTIILRKSQERRNSLEPLRNKTLTSSVNVQSRMRTIPIRIPQHDLRERGIASVDDDVIESEARSDFQQSSKSRRESFKSSRQNALPDKKQLASLRQLFPVTDSPDGSLEFSVDSEIPGDSGESETKTNQPSDTGPSVRDQNMELTTTTAEESALEDAGEVQGASAAPGGECVAPAEALESLNAPRVEMKFIDEEGDDGYDSPGGLSTESGSNSSSHSQPLAASDSACAEPHDGQPRADEKLETIGETVSASERPSSEEDSDNTDAVSDNSTYSPCVVIGNEAAVGGSSVGLGRRDSFQRAMGLVGGTRSVSPRDRRLIVRQSALPYSPPGQTTGLYTPGDLLVTSEHPPTYHMPGDSRMTSEQSTTSHTSGDSRMTSEPRPTDITAYGEVDKSINKEKREAVSDLSLYECKNVGSNQCFIGGEVESVVCSEDPRVGSFPDLSDTRDDADGRSSSLNDSVNSVVSTGRGDPRDPPGESPGKVQVGRACDKAGRVAGSGTGSRASVSSGHQETEECYEQTTDMALATDAYHAGRYLPPTLVRPRESSRDPAAPRLASSGSYPALSPGADDRVAIESRTNVNSLTDAEKTRSVDVTPQGQDYDLTGSEVGSQRSGRDLEEQAGTPVGVVQREGRTPRTGASLPVSLGRSEHGERESSSYGGVHHVTHVITDSQRGTRAIDLSATHSHLSHNAADARSDSQARESGATGRADDLVQTGLAQIPVHVTTGSDTHGYLPTQDYTGLIQGHTHNTGLTQENTHTGLTQLDTHIGLTQGSTHTGPTLPVQQGQTGLSRLPKQGHRGRDYIPSAGETGGTGPGYAGGEDPPGPSLGDGPRPAARPPRRVTFADPLTITSPESPPPPRGEMGNTQARRGGPQYGYSLEVTPSRGDGEEDRLEDSPPATRGLSEAGLETRTPWTDRGHPKPPPYPAPTPYTQYSHHNGNTPGHQGETLETTDKASPDRSGETFPRLPGSQAPAHTWAGDRYAQVKETDVDADLPVVNQHLETRQDQRIIPGGAMDGYGNTQVQARYGGGRPLAPGTGGGYQGERQGPGQPPVAGPGVPPPHGPAPDTRTSPYLSMGHTNSAISTTVPDNNTTYQPTPASEYVLPDRGYANHGYQPSRGYPGDKPRPQRPLSASQVPLTVRREGEGRYGGTGEGGEVARRARGAGDRARDRPLSAMERLRPKVAFKAPSTAPSGQSATAPDVTSARRPLSPSNHSPALLPLEPGMPSNGSYVIPDSPTKPSPERGVSPPTVPGGYLDGNIPVYGDHEQFLRETGRYYPTDDEKWTYKMESQKANAERAGLKHVPVQHLHSAGDTTTVTAAPPDVYLHNQASMGYHGNRATRVIPPSPQRKAPTPQFGEPSPKIPSSPRGQSGPVRGPPPYAQSPPDSPQRKVVPSSPPGHTVPISVAHYTSQSQPTSPLREQSGLAHVGERLGFSYHRPSSVHPDGSKTLPRSNVHNDHQRSSALDHPQVAVDSRNTARISSTEQKSPAGYIDSAKTKQILGRMTELRLSKVKIKRRPAQGQTANTRPMTPSSVMSDSHNTSASSLVTSSSLASEEGRYDSLRRGVLRDKQPAWQAQPIPGYRPASEIPFASYMEDPALAEMRRHSADPRTAPPSDLRQLRQGAPFTDNSQRYRQGEPLYAQGPSKAPATRPASATFARNEPLRTSNASSTATASSHVSGLYAGGRPLSDYAMSAMMTSQHSLAETRSRSRDNLADGGALAPQRRKYASSADIYRMLEGGRQNPYVRSDNNNY